ncbi:MAG: hypothetical protein AAGJ10_18570 [Bacteroidota bacterium]
MIRPLRTRHRVMVSTLAVVLPVLFVASLLVRQHPAVMDTLPVPVSAEAPSLLRSETTATFGALSVSLRVYEDARPATRLAVALRPDASPSAPDVLAYWSETPPSAATLPDAAILLGTLAGPQSRTFMLPEAALRTEGYLILYSLGHQALLGSSPLSSSTR